MSFFSATNNNGEIPRRLPGNARGRNRLHAEHRKTRLDPHALTGKEQYCYSRTHIDCRCQNSDITNIFIMTIFHFSALNCTRFFSQPSSFRRRFCPRKNSNRTSRNTYASILHIGSNTVFLYQHMHIDESILVVTLWTKTNTDYNLKQQTAYPQFCNITKIETIREYFLQTADH